MSDPATIIIERSPGGFKVTTPGGQLDAEFPTHRAAYGYASGLRMTQGWRISDLSGGAA